MEKEKRKPAPDPLLLLALRCSRASHLLSSLHRPSRSTTRMMITRRTSSAASMEFELRNAGLVDAELAAARREANMLARLPAAEVLLVVALVPLLLLLFVGILTAAKA